LGSTAFGIRARNKRKAIGSQTVSMYSNLEGNNEQHERRAGQKEMIFDNVAFAESVDTRL
jgi:hypothetical protein